MIPPVGGEMLFERWIFFAKIQKISEPTPTSLLFIKKWTEWTTQHPPHNRTPLLTIGHLTSQPDRHTSQHARLTSPHFTSGCHTSQPDRFTSQPDHRGRFSMITFFILFWEALALFSTLRKAQSAPHFYLQVFNLFFLFLKRSVFWFFILRNHGYGDLESRGRRFWFQKFLRITEISFRIQWIITWITVIYVKK